MSYAIISYQVLNDYTSPPPQFSNIDINTWQTLRSCVTYASNTANTNACIGELLICFCLGFPCIFLCHPCVYLCLKEQQLRRDITNLNYSRYGGQPVFSMCNEGINVWLDGIPVTEQHVLRFTVQTEATIPVVPVTVISPAPVTSGASAEAHSVNTDRKAAPVTPVASAAPQAATGSRTMVVELPPDVYPFANINVPTPDGHIISVSAPHNAQPGMHLTVQY